MPVFLYVASSALDSARKSLYSCFSMKWRVNEMESTLRRTWAEINLDHLEYNYRQLRKRIGDNCKFLGVVKADAYGHGAIHVAKALQTLGADYLAVSSLDEAMELRKNGISMPVLLLGHTPVEQVGKLIAYSITQTVTCEAKAIEYSQEAVRLGGTLKVHIKLDTGMSRLGFLCQGDHFEGGVEAVARSCQLPNLQAEGIFTHFSVSDDDAPQSRDYTLAQGALFERFIAAVQDRGVTFELRHCANTGAVANYPQFYLDMVRPGLLLYGYGESARRLGLEPVMSLKSVIHTIKIFDEQVSISYGRTYETTHKARIGVLPIGYADGFFRCLSNRYWVHTRYVRAPIRGRICMDMTMVDLTDLPQVQVDDEVEIFGQNNSIDVMADLAGTIAYEISCAVSKRVPRVFLQNGREIDRELRLLDGGVLEAEL